jgi:hypothetical protein
MRGVMSDATRGVTGGGAGQGRGARSGRGIAQGPRRGTAIGVVRGTGAIGTDIGLARGIAIDGVGGTVVRLRVATGGIEPGVAVGAAADDGISGWLLNGYQAIARMIVPGEDIHITFVCIIELMQPFRGEEQERTVYTSKNP